MSHIAAIYAKLVPISQSGYGRTALWLSLVIIFIISGCAYTKIDKIGNEDFIPKDKSAEILLVEGDINRKYKSVAYLNVVGAIVTKKKRIANRMKKEARKVGGDAVLFVTYSKEPGLYPMVTGVIVVYE
ncbi:MAG: hypothetical protein ACUZ8H_02610 [Candidatus Anammoxibacter sp.]